MVVWVQSKLQQNTTNWKDFVCTGEMESNLGGFDGALFCRHDHKKERETFYCWVQEERLVVVRDAIRFSSKLDLIGIDVKKDSKFYTKLLQNCFSFYCWLTTRKGLDILASYRGGAYI